MAAQDILGDRLIGYAQGCEIEGNSTEGIAEAVALARKADIAVVLVGLTPSNDPTNSGTPAVTATGSGFENEGHDRTQISLMGEQLNLIQQVLAVNPRTVVVLIHGGAIAMEWTKDNVPAILDAHYPGQMGGDALWRILLNIDNAAPAGRLTTTAYKADFVERPMTDMSLNNITYKHYRGTPNWEFGFGLSYSKFQVEWLNTTSAVTTEAMFASHQEYFQARANDDKAWRSSAAYSAKVTNVGTIASDYVLLGFVSSPSRRLADPAEPLRELFDFSRVSLQPGESTVITLSVPPSVLSHVDELGDERLMAGKYTIEFGRKELGDESHLESTLDVTGADQMLFSFSKLNAKREVDHPLFI